MKHLSLILSFSIACKGSDRSESRSGDGCVLMKRLLAEATIALVPGTEKHAPKPPQEMWEDLTQLWSVDYVELEEETDEGIKQVQTALERVQTYFQTILDNHLGEGSSLYQTHGKCVLDLGYRVNADDEMNIFKCTLTFPKYIREEVDLKHDAKQDFQQDIDMASLKHWKCHAAVSLKAYGGLDEDLEMISQTHSNFSGNGLNTYLRAICIVLSCLRRIPFDSTADNPVTIHVLQKFGMEYKQLEMQDMNSTEADVNDAFSKLPREKLTHLVQTHNNKYRRNSANHILELFGQVKKYVASNIRSGEKSESIMKAFRKHWNWYVTPESGLTATMACDRDPEEFATRAISILQKRLRRVRQPLAVIKE